MVHTVKVKQEGAHMILANVYNTASCCYTVTCHYICARETLAWCCGEHINCGLCLVRLGTRARSNMLEEVTVQQGRHKLTLAKQQALLWGSALPLSTALGASTGYHSTGMDIVILKLFFP